jgi:hypothetical protein
MKHVPAKKLKGLTTCSARIMESVRTIVDSYGSTVPQSSGLTHEHGTAIDSTDRPGHSVCIFPSRHYMPNFRLQEVQNMCRSLYEVIICTVQVSHAFC